MPKQYRDSLLALFVAGFLFFNYPLLALFNHTLLWCGIPILYGYLFTVWLGLIGMAAWLINRSK